MSSPYRSYFMGLPVPHGSQSVASKGIAFFGGGCSCEHTRVSISPGILANCKILLDKRVIFYYTFWIFVGV